MWSHFIFFFALIWKTGSAMTVNSCSDSLPRDTHLTVFQNKCYYFYLNMQRGFEGAQNVCKEKGGNLASIKTQIDHDFILNKLKNDYRFHGNVWIGLVGKDLKGNGQLMDGTKEKYINYYSRRPSQSNNCYTLKVSTGKLVGVDCMNMLTLLVGYSFVCEFPPKEVLVGPAASTYQCPASIPENKYRKLLDNTCYYFHFDDKLTSPTAQGECRRKGGNLVSIKTQKIQDFIWKTLKETYKFEGDVWIGLGDEKREGHFVWRDGSKMDYQNFRRGEFSNHWTNRHEDCVNMYAKTGKWYENGCRYSGFFKRSTKYYICEFPAIAISRQLPATTKATMQPPQRITTTTTSKTSTPSISKFPVSSTPSVMKTIFECPSSLPHDKYLDILDKDCFYFHFDKKLESPQAQSVCQEQGGNLAAIKTEHVQNFLWKKLQNTYHFEGDVWIGLGDERSEDVFEWKDGSKMTFENFDNKTSTRSKYYGKSNNCVAMHAKSGKWFDHPCGPILRSTYEKYFVCQFSAVQKRLEETTSTQLTTRTTKTTPPPSPPSTTTKTTTTQSQTPPSTENPTPMAKSLNTTKPKTYTIPTREHTSSKTKTTTTATTKTTTLVTDDSVRNSPSSETPISATTNEPATATVSRTGDVSTKPGINQTDATEPDTEFEQTTKPTPTSHFPPSTDSTSVFPKYTTTPNGPKLCPVCKLDCGDKGFTTDFINGCIICKCL